MYNSFLGGGGGDGMDLDIRLREQAVVKVIWWAGGSDVVLATLVRLFSLVPSLQYSQTSTNRHLL